MESPNETNLFEQREALFAWAAALPLRPLDFTALSDADEARLKELEVRAQALAVPEQDLQGDDVRIRDEARQAFLIDLHGVGLFEREPSARVAAELFPHLADIQDAVEQLHAYLGSEERGALRDGDPTNDAIAVLCSPVSLEYFRRGPFIGGVCKDHEIHRWAAWGEETLRWKDHSGTMFWSSGAVFETFHFQLETPYRASLTAVGRPVGEAVAAAHEQETGVEPSARLETVALQITERAEESRSVALARLAGALTHFRLQHAPTSPIARETLARLRGLSKSVPDAPERPTSADLDRALHNVDLALLVRQLDLSTREEVAMVLSAHPEHAARVGAILRDALAPAEHNARRGGAPPRPVSRFAKRYILKRLQPESKEALRALKQLRGSAEAEALQPFLRNALERFPKKRFWLF